MNIIQIVAMFILLLGILWICSNIQNEIHKLRLDLAFFVAEQKLKEKDNHV